MRHRLLHWLAALAIFAFGCILRLGVWHPPAAPGFDEQVYQRYVADFDARGWAGFPETVRTYVVKVQQAEFVYLTPFRIGYTYPAWLLTRLFHLEGYQALRVLSALASCAYLLAGFLFARRWLGARPGLAVLALLACAPLQIHLGQYAFIDALAGCWAVLAAGFVWESLQRPTSLPSLLAAGVSFFALCLTKQETAVFMGIFFAVAVLLARPLRWCAAPWRPAAALAVAGLLAVLLLAVLSGGCATMLRAFSIYHERAQTLPYTIQTGDGPWHRYLLEYLLINPLVFLLAIGFVFRAQLRPSWNGYFLLLLAVTGVVMSSIPFGFNLRHTVMWDFPLALFAVQCLAALLARARWPAAWATVAIAVLCYSELQLYTSIFRGLYDTDLRFMLRAVRLVK